MDGGGDSMPTTVAGSGVPNEAALLALMEKSGYQMLQENGQRKYGGPPPNWEGPAPLRGCEIFIGKIPRDCYEDELVPVFEKVGKIYELRLMMDFSGSNRGYAFVMYTNKADAVKAVKELNNYEIRKGRLLGVCLSVDNCRLFVGGIPKNKQKDEIHTEMDKVTEGVVDVIVYPSAQDKSKNRGFAFVEYESHRSAAMARRKLIPGRIQLWGHQIAVDWAEPEQEVDEEVMKNVKILYVRNLMLTTTEETLEEVFTKAAGNDGCVERVKKIRDYAFVHFRERQDAITAMHQLNGQLVDNARVEVCLAKPVDKTDYVRYTRGGHAPQFQQGYAGGFEAVPFTGGAPQYYGQFGNMPVGRGFTPAARGGMRPPMMRGRGRGAAGSRAAGGRGGYTHPGFRGKHPAEDRLFNIRPGMKLTPTDPITLKPQSMKSPVQTLEEFCTKNGMGSPVYQLHSAIDRESNGDVQLFLYKVAIPALASTYPNSAIQPPQLCRSVEEAKVYAAEFALGQLGVPMEAVPFFM
ncbi:unnamed protein product [Owenia fusiformis]|uniref:RRM domain-containing protein n=1 Tax=Owenia fusiformis TaxID=6347 RepID=A0A8S4NXX1_OWEFU|nr:unnamed protein product [Owenia fusiformis]